MYFMDSLLGLLLINSMSLANVSEHLARTFISIYYSLYIIHIVHSVVMH